MSTPPTAGRTSVPLLERLGRSAIFLVAIGALLWMAARLAAPLAPLVVSLALAIILCALLLPVQLLLNHRMRLHRMVAAAMSVLGFVGLLGCLFYLVERRVGPRWESLRTSLGSQLETLESTVVASDLPLGKASLAESLDLLGNWLLDNQDSVVGGIVSIGSGATSVAFGAFLGLLSAFFLLATGDSVWSWIIDQLPASQGKALYEAGRRGWVTLATYVRMQVVIAAVDAIGITLGAWALGLPFLVPMGLVAFVLCVIPFLGAIVSGGLYVLLAFLTGGTTTALVMLAVVIVVQQLESDLLSPILMGKAVNLHPLAVLLGAAAGTYLIGYVGALFAVPALAVGNAMRRYLAGDDPFPGLADGGSALADPARRLAPSGPRESPARRLGDVRPARVEDDPAC